MSPAPFRLGCPLGDARSLYLLLHHPFCPSVVCLPPNFLTNLLFLLEHSLYILFPISSFSHFLHFFPIILLIFLFLFLLLLLLFLFLLPPVHIGGRAHYILGSCSRNFLHLATPFVAPFASSAFTSPQVISSCNHCTQAA